MAIVSSSAGGSPAPAAPAPAAPAAQPRLVDGAAQGPEDDAASPSREDGLRPKRLADYVGQRELKQVLAIAVAASRQRGDALDHVLLHGPPGLG
ncbi:MAG: Holliday junction branch migration DNA helicase RuvB, partial [Prochlorococcaceae cyanobacterium]